MSVVVIAGISIVVDDDVGLADDALTFCCCVAIFDANSDDGTPLKAAAAATAGAIDICPSLITFGCCCCCCANNNAVAVLGSIFVSSR